MGLFRPFINRRQLEPIVPIVVHEYSDRSTEIVYQELINGKYQTSRLLIKNFIFNRHYPQTRESVTRKIKEIEAREAESKMISA